MKYLTLKDLQSMYEKYGNVLDIALKILGTNDSETLAWYRISKDVMKRRDREKMEKLDEWFQELQQNMFGDNLPKPKPTSLGKELLPPYSGLVDAIKDVQVYKNIINESLFPYLSYFCLSGIGLWYEILGYIFFLNSLDGRYKTCFPSTPLKFIEKEDQIRRKDIQLACRKKCELLPLANFEITDTQTMGNFKDPYLAEEIMKSALELVVRKCGNKIEGKLIEVELLADERLPYFLIPGEMLPSLTRHVIDMNIKEGNLEVGEGLKPFILSSFLFKPTIPPKELREAFNTVNHIYKFLGIEQEDFWNQYALAIKRIVFRK